MRRYKISRRKRGKGIQIKRNIFQLAQREYDLLIMGGGIHGATLAREASLRGLAVALVDQDDFCAATSANSLKIIHGGIRYLQQFDLARLRQSVRARRIFMQLAPHLVHPLPCAMPTHGHLLKSREVMFFGLLLNDCLSWDRNRGLAPGKVIPAGRIGSRAEWLAIAPELDDPRYTGVALWNDAYAYNTERLGLGFVQAAAQAGAAAANYLKVTGFQRRGRDVAGVTALDRLTGQSLTITAKLTVINTGPWTTQTLGLLGDGVTYPKVRLALAMNLVLRRQLIPRYAVGLMLRQEGWKTNRLFFFVPWRDRTMVGTYLRPHAGSPELLKVTEDDLSAFVSILNQAYPGARLQPEDIALIHAGLLPAEDRPVAAGAEPKLLTRFQIIDHAAVDGINGLLTVLGVKYTTAGEVAQITLAKAETRLGRLAPPADSSGPLLPGGDLADLDRLIREAAATGLTAATALRLVYNYGTRCRDVIRLGREDPQLLTPVSESAGGIGAEVIHAAREEMAMTLADVVLRRTDLGSAGLPDEAGLRNAGLLMARELGWDAARRSREIEELKALPNCNPETWQRRFAMAPGAATPAES